MFPHFLSTPVIAAKLANGEESSLFRRGTRKNFLQTSNNSRRKRERALNAEINREKCTSEAESTQEELPSSSVTAKVELLIFCSNVSAATRTVCSEELLPGQWLRYLQYKHTTECIGDSGSMKIYGKTPLFKVHVMPR